jgi:hypothetical protein
MSTPGMPVSGPGKFSQRTDKQPMAQLSNADYGEQKAYKQLQQDAPMASSPDMPGGAPLDLSQLFQGAASNVVPLDAPSQQPGTPVTDGAAAGPGAGINALGINKDLRQEDLERIKSYMPVLEFMANQTGASWAMRNLVRKVKGIV